MTDEINPGDPGNPSKGAVPFRVAGFILIGIAGALALLGANSLPELNKASDSAEKYGSLPSTIEIKDPTGQYTTKLKTGGVRDHAEAEYRAAKRTTALWFAGAAAALIAGIIQFYVAARRAAPPAHLRRSRRRH